MAFNTFQKCAILSRKLRVMGRKTNLNNFRLRLIDNKNVYNGAGGPQRAKQVVLYVSH